MVQNISITSGSTFISDKCNDLTKDIWELFIKEQTSISVEHMPGSKNCTADFFCQIH